MSDSYHELMSHLFNSPSNIPKSSYQLTGIMHCRVANNSRSATRPLGLPAYAVADWSEGREGREAARSANLPTYTQTTPAVYRHYTRYAQKESRKSEDIMSTPLRKRRKVRTAGERHIRKPFPLGLNLFSSSKDPSSV